MCSACIYAYIYGCVYIYIEYMKTSGLKTMPVLHPPGCLGPEARDKPREWMCSDRILNRDLIVAPIQILKQDSCPLGFTRNVETSMFLVLIKKL